MSDTSHKPRISADPSGADDRRGARRGAIIILAALVAFVVYLFVTGQVAQFLAAMRNVDVSWLVVACASMLLYLFFGIVAYAIAVWLDPKSPVGIRDLISVEASGVFFGNLTPLMMGSTPAQIYRLTKAGQHVSEAGAIQFTRFLVYQFALVLWGAILLVGRMPFFMRQYGDITLICVFSFGGHVLILVSILAIALMPHMVVRVGHGLIRILERMGVSKEKLQAWNSLIDEEVHTFSYKFKLAAGHLGSMALTLGITMLQLAFFYLVPYFLMLSFGCYNVDFFSVMAASAFVQLLSSAVPLPGGTGGAEGGFALFLGHFFGGAATAGYLLWRLITFIAPTILAAPLLGLKSAHTMSIHERWDRLMKRSGRVASSADDTKCACTSAVRSARQRDPQGTSAGLVGVASSDAALRQPVPSAIDECCAREKQERVSSDVRAPRLQGARVEKTGDGIRVNPRAFKRAHK